MRKRILSIMLSIAVIAAMIPSYGMVTFAESSIPTKVTINEGTASSVELGLSNDSFFTTAENGSLSSGSSTSYSVWYEAATATLHLKDATLKGISAVGGLTIDIKGNNIITGAKHDGNEIGICVTGSDSILNLIGNGRIDVSSADNETSLNCNISAYGIYANNNLVIDGPVVYAKAGNITSTSDIFDKTISSIGCYAANIMKLKNGAVYFSAGNTSKNSFDGEEVSRGFKGNYSCTGNEMICKEGTKYNLNTINLIDNEYSTAAGSVIFKAGCFDIEYYDASLSQEVFTYDGNPKTPEVTVNGLKYNEDYYLNYNYNTSVGIAYVNVCGMGDFNGTKKMLFRIQRADCVNDFYVYTSDGKNKEYIINESGEIKSKEGNPLTLPDGLSWDNTDKTLVMNNFTGQGIISYQSGKQLNLRVIGENTLEGINSYGLDNCAIYISNGDVCIDNESTGNLNVNINKPNNSTRGIYVPSGGFILNGGTVNIFVNSKTGFANGIYARYAILNNNSSLSADIICNSKSILHADAVYGGDLYVNTTGNVNFRSNDCAMSSMINMMRPGNVWVIGDDSATCYNEQYLNNVTKYDFNKYGKYDSKALVLLGNLGILTEVTDYSVSLDSPVTDEAPQRIFTGDQVGGIVSWGDNSPAFFDENTVYTANIELFPAPGYKMGELSTALFTGKVPGAASVAYDGGRLTVSYTATGQTAKESINTTFNLNVPKAGESLASTVSNSDCTGKVDWYKVVNDEEYSVSASEAEADTIYIAKVTVSLKDGVDKTFLKVPADSYTVAGGTVTNEAKSKTFKVVFPKTGNAALNATVDGVNCTPQTDYSQFNGKVLYDSETDSLILNGYSGEYIVNRYEKNPLRIIVKGENTLTGKVIVNAEVHNIYSYGGPVYINGIDDAVLNLKCDVESDSYKDSRAVMFNSYSNLSNLYLDNIRLNISMNQKKQGSVTTAIYGRSVHIGNHSKVKLDLTGNSTNWARILWADLVIDDETETIPFEYSTNDGYFDFTYLTNSPSYTLVTSGNNGNIVLKDVSKWDFTVEDDELVYSGSPMLPEISGLGILKKDTDYTLSYDGDNINAGKGAASVTVTGDGTLFVGSTTKQYDIESFDISSMTAKLSKASYVYTGSKINLSASVSGLKSGTDFTVTSSNINCGKATAIIAGKGNYKGTIKKTFNIIPKAAAFSKASSGSKKISLKIKSQKSAGVSGYQIYYKKAGSSAKQVYTTSTSKTLKRLSKGKKYTVKVRAYVKIGNTKYYGAYSKAKTIKVK